LSKEEKKKERKPSFSGKKTSLDAFRQGDVQTKKGGPPHGGEGKKKLVALRRPGGEKRESRARRERTGRCLSVGERKKRGKGGGKGAAHPPREKITANFSFCLAWGHLLGNRREKGKRGGGSLREKQKARFGLRLGGKTLFLQGEKKRDCAHEENPTCCRSN